MNMVIAVIIQYLIGGKNQRNVINVEQLVMSSSIAPNVIWLYAGGAKKHKTFNLHKRLLKERKLGLNANPHLRKTNVSTSFL